MYHNFGKKWNGFLGDIGFIPLKQMFSVQSYVLWQFVNPLDEFGRELRVRGAVAPLRRYVDRVSEAVR